MATKNIGISVVWWHASALRKSTQTCKTALRRRRSHVRIVSGPPSCWYCFARVRKGFFDSALADAAQNTLRYARLVERQRRIPYSPIGHAPGGASVRPAPSGTPEALIPPSNRNHAPVTTRDDIGVQPSLDHCETAFAANSFAKRHLASLSRKTTSAPPCRISEP